MYYLVYYGYSVVGVAIKDLGDDETTYFILNCVDFKEHFNDFRKKVVKKNKFDLWWANNCRYTTAYYVKGV